MDYVDEFELEVRRRLNGMGDEPAFVRWVTEKLRETYMSGIAAGKNGVQVIRKGQSRGRMPRKLVGMGNIEE